MVRSRLVVAMAGVASWLSPTPAGAGAPEVVLQGVRFAPREITIGAGETVTWLHRDSALNHHVMADDGSFNSYPLCGVFLSVCMKGGDTYRHRFPQPGVYGYHCRLHGSPGRGMAGTVTVTGA